MSWPLLSQTVTIYEHLKTKLLYMHYICIYTTMKSLNFLKYSHTVYYQYATAIYRKFCNDLMFL